jgi:hypothetical protein
MCESRIASERNYTSNHHEVHESLLIGTRSRSARLANTQLINTSLQGGVGAGVVCVRLAHTQLKLGVNWNPQQVGPARQHPTN